MLWIVLELFISSVGFAEEKLVFAIDLVRHGDRTPLTNSPAMQEIWPQGPGQLTPKGMQQEYDLGTFLRRQYIDKYHLLPERYDVNTMNVRSSNTPRTMMSAQSILIGLYPLGKGPLLKDSTYALPSGFQPIAINTVPKEQDSLLVSRYNKAEYQQLLETYILRSEDWLRKDTALKPNYPAWSKVAGFSIDHLYDLKHFADRLYIERIYQVPLPQGLTEEEADLIIDAGKWAFLYIANHPKLGVLGANELAKTIKQEFNLAAEQNRPLKYLLLVAHDTTLAPQLRLLGQRLEDIPPYASQINYSLYETDQSGYEVRVTYNQKPLYIEYCGGYSCRLSQFSNMIDSMAQD